jgi:hypothetical protein
MIIVAFAAVQSGRLAPTRLSYSLLNLVGAILILVSLTFNFNFASVVIEVFWILISLWGVINWIRNRPVSKTADAPSERDA